MYINNAKIIVVKIGSSNLVDSKGKLKENLDFTSLPQYKTRCIATQTDVSTPRLHFYINFMIFLAELKFSNLYRCHAIMIIIL